ncbi:hypothetical protein [Amycolatopsis sp. lyj-23]|uniref:hypothetical protein n=1 Tax=Amycolatopsis sp. lyj-23 TaxID=2789283 RepID=UPI00397E8FDA
MLRNVALRRWPRGSASWLSQDNTTNRDRTHAGGAYRDVAAVYWNFGYDQAQGTITLGPDVLEIDTAVTAAGPYGRDLPCRTRHRPARNGPAARTDDPRAVQARRSARYGIA